MCACSIPVPQSKCFPCARPHCMPLQSPFSFLNLSHASFNVANTAALIILCSVVAFCGILSGCTFAIAFMYTILTLFAITSSFMPTFVHLHENSQQHRNSPLQERKEIRIPGLKPQHFIQAPQQGSQIIALRTLPSHQLRIHSIGQRKSLIVGPLG